MNRVFLDFGNFKIYWYSVLILLGVIIGIVLITKEARRVNLSSVLISDLCFFVIPVSIIGARLYYVIFNFDSFKNDLSSIFKIWEGGIAIYGGILAGIIYIIWYCQKKELSILKTLDLFAPSLILAQAIGRWGNFFNKEAYGQIVSRATLEKMHLPNFIIDGMFINNNYHQPTFLYESIWCFLGFIVLILIRYLYKNNKIGNLTFIYFIWYSAERYIVEGLRLDSLYIGDYRVSQLVAIGLILIGIVGLLTSKKRPFYHKIDKNIDNNKEVLDLG